MCLIAYMEALKAGFKGAKPDVTEENLQARIRGIYLMALSNKFGWLVLSTGNKSEISTGYCTLYGDMAGGFAVLKDVMKTTVFRLAEHCNRISGANGFRASSSRSRLRRNCVRINWIRIRFRLMTCWIRF